MRDADIVGVSLTIGMHTRDTNSCPQYGNLALRIRAEVTPNASAPTGAPYSESAVYSRLTSASITWNIPECIDVTAPSCGWQPSHAPLHAPSCANGTDDQAEFMDRTPDLSSLLSEVVAQPGWQQGNSVRGASPESLAPRSLLLSCRVCAHLSRRVTLATSDRAAH